MPVNPAIIQGLQTNFEATVEQMNRYCWQKSTAPDLIEAGRTQLAQTDPDVLINDFAACGQFDVDGKLEPIAVPTLIICGVADKMMPPTFSQQLADQMSNSQLVTITNSGHMMQLEQPIQTAAAIDQFLNSLSN